MTTSPTNPLAGVSPAALDTDADRVLAPLSDGELLAAVAGLLAVPNEEVPDSFALHAPLEVMARAALLARVSADTRHAARYRLAAIATAWATDGTPLADPDTTDVDEPAELLATALADGDLEVADRALVALCHSRDPDLLIDDLADTVLPHLGGAGHGSIFLELLPRFRPIGVHPGLMARTLVRDLARHPDWRLSWFEQDRPTEAAPIGTLTERLLAPRADRRPENHFIHPTMSLVEEIGLADELLADATVAMPVSEARRCLLRIAAMSMLQDDPAHAPYGWSHCLTMPQAALAIADRATDAQRAVDVAATYVLGFRATQGATAIDPAWAPDPPEPDRSAPRPGSSVVELAPAEAAAVAWHTTDAGRSAIVQQLVDHAAPHPDAHLAKYTQACLDATAAEPDDAHLFVAAAAYLGAWWHTHDRGQDPTAR